MTDLRAAARQLLDACEQRLPLKGQAEIIDELNNLRAALAEPVQEQYPLHDQQLRDDAERWKNIRGYVEEMEREIKTLRAALAEPVQCADNDSPWLICKPCAAEGVCKKAEPQEPDSPERRCGGPWCDMTCCQPVEEPVAWLVTTEMQDGTRRTHPLTGRFKDVKDACDFGDPVPLYTAPPKRKPLTEEEIREMFFAELRALPSYPSAIEELPERLARAIERAHGIGGEA